MWVPLLERLLVELGAAELRLGVRVVACHRVAPHRQDLLDLRRDGRHQVLLLLNLVVGLLVCHRDLD